MASTYITRARSAVVKVCPLDIIRYLEGPDPSRGRAGANIMNESKRIVGDCRVVLKKLIADGVKAQMCHFSVEAQ